MERAPPSARCEGTPFLQSMAKAVHMEMLILGVGDVYYHLLALWYCSCCDRAPGQLCGHLVMLWGITMQFKFISFNKRWKINKNKQTITHETWVVLLVSLPPSETPMGKFPEHKLIWKDLFVLSWGEAEGRKVGAAPTEIRLSRECSLVTDSWEGGNQVNLHTPH